LTSLFSLSILTVEMEVFVLDGEEEFNIRRGGGGGRGVE
jgi:hypothetical protein